MKNKKMRNRIIFGSVSLLVLLSICDMRLKIVKYEVRTDKIEKQVRIALVTDLHGCKYGKNQKNLIEAIEKENPDIVLLGGDIFDDNVPYENSTITIKQLAETYPCYYVTGNHEYWSKVLLFDHYLTNGDLERIKKAVNNVKELVEDYTNEEIEEAIDEVVPYVDEITLYGDDKAIFF